MSDEANNTAETVEVMSRMGRGTKNVAEPSENEKIITPEYQMKHNHLLVIAVDHYHDEQIPDLKNCLNDIEDLLEILTTHYFFNRDNVRFLRSRIATDAEAQTENEAREISYAAMVAEATHDNIIAQLKELAKTLTPEDNLIICFSGHGIYDEDFDEGYWIPSDGRLDHNSSYIENGTIRTALNAIKTHHTVLISDSCYSGTLFSGGQTRSLTVPRIYSQASRWGITAGRKEPVSDGTLGDNSPFAKELLDILSKKREVWIADLINEIIRRVTDENNEKQSPVGEALSFIKGHQNGQFVFFPRLATEEDYWEMAWQENTRKGYYAFLARYPNGRYEETALEALNVFANRDGQQPAFSEEALATYRLLQKYLPDEAKSYTGSFLNGETRSVLLADYRSMYEEVMAHFTKDVERELKAFVLLGENASSQEKLLKEYQRLKGDEEQLKKKFKRAFIKHAKGNPYKGLNAYEEEDSPVFFGRKAVTYKIIDQLQTNRLVIISAPAYTGKTSLVLAGIYPTLRATEASYELLRMPAGEAPSSYEHHSRIIPRIKKDKKQLLFIDAMEQLFAQNVKEKESVAFQEALIKLISEAHPNLFLVICLKSDFEKQLRISPLSKAINMDAHLYRLPVLSDKELQKVLLGPMWNSSVEYESDELVAQMIKEVKGAPNALPLLSATLKELYDSVVKEDDKTIRQERNYTKVSVHTAIDTIADDRYYPENSSEEEKRVLRKIFLRMVEPLGDGRYKSRTLWDFEFRHPNQNEMALIEDVLRIFGDEDDLLEVIRDESKIAGIKPKDLLITNWSRLGDWIAYFGYENIVLQRELTKAARDKNLWDNDPRLKQVIDHIMAESHSLIKSNDPDLAERLAAIEADLEAPDQALFSKFIDDWKDSELPPALDDAILTGGAYSLLEALLQSSTHWLSEEESNFVLESWDKKVGVFMALKEERDEAIIAKEEATVAKTQAQAAKKQTEKLLQKALLQTQAFKAKYQEQTHKDLLFIQQGFRPNLHLILVGIDDYPGIHKLSSCVADVQAIAKAFSTQKGKLYKEIFLHVMTDKDATKDNILKRVAAVRESAGVLDFVFVYLAGQSLQIPKTVSNDEKEIDGSFITYSAEFKKSDKLAEVVYLKPEGHGIHGIGATPNPSLTLSGQELCTALMQFKCKVILTLDISYGGEFLSTLIAANHSDKPELLSHYVFGLSGTSTNELSKEGRFGGESRGAFSYAFTKSITTNEADLDGNGVLYLDELLRYTSKVVTESVVRQNVLAVVPPIMTNIPLFQLGDAFAFPEVELALSGHITDDAVIKSINTFFD